MVEPRDRLSAAFAELAASVLSETRLPGVEAAHVAVRRRRRRRHLTLAAAVVTVLLLAPAAAVALLRGTGGLGPDVGGTPTAPSVSPSPSGPATPTTTSEPAPGGLSIIGDAYVRQPTPLDDALLPIPSFDAWESPCPVGATRYTDGVWQGPNAGDPPAALASEIREVATGDVNRDQVTDWVAVISCQVDLPLGNRGIQVVAFTRNGNGPFTLLGQVFVAGQNYGVEQPEVTADGVVRFIVSGPYESGAQSQAERHSMRWDGARFVAAAAPEAIPFPDPTQLTLTVTPSTVSSRETVLTISIHNGGSESVDYLVLNFSADLSDSPAGQSTAISIRPEGLPALLPVGSCQGWFDCSWAVSLEPVPPGQSASGRFTVSLSTPVSGLLRAHVTGVSLAYGHQPNATNSNALAVPITTA